jgi:hypothetical protein
MNMISENTTTSVSQQVTFNIMGADVGNSEVYIGEQQPSGYQGKTLATGPEGCSSWSVPLTGLGFGGASIYNDPGTPTCALLETEYPFIGMQSSSAELLYDLINADQELTMEVDSYNMYYFKDTLCDSVID